MPDVAPRRLYYGWPLLVSLGVITIISYGTLQYFFGILVVPVAQELGASRADISVSYSAALLVGGLLGYPIGRWVDRRGSRAVLAAGAVVAGASLIALSRAHELWQWNVLWGGGLGAAIAMTQYPVTFTVVANWFDRRRGSAMAVLTLLGGLASPIFLPLAGWLVPRIGWRETLVIFGLVHLLVSLPLALLVVRRHPEDLGLFPDGAPSAGEAATTPLSGVSARRAMQRLPFWTLTLTSLLGLLGSNVLFAHQVAYMIDRGQDPALAATLAGLIGVASLPGRYLLNTLSDRFSSQRLLGITQLTLAAGVALLVFGTSTATLLAYVVVYGSAFGTAGALAASVRAEHFGRRAFGAIGALQGYPGLGGAALGPIAAGWLYDRTGAYTLAFATVAALYLVGALAMFATPRPEVTRRSAAQPASR